MPNADFANTHISENIIRDLLIDIIDKLHGYKIQHNKQLLYKLFFINKYVMNILSALHLRNGVPLSNKNTETRLYDNSACNTVARSAVETFLLYHYLFISATTDDEKNLRFLAWWREGLITRQKFTAPNEEYIIRKNIEKISITDTERQIAENPRYSALDDKYKKHFLKGSNWRPSWYKLIELAGITNSIISDYYGFLCSYSHTESLSLIQMVNTDSYEFAKELNNGTYTLLFTISALFIKSIFVQFSDIDFIISGENMKCIDYWESVALFKNLT